MGAQGQSPLGRVQVERHVEVVVGARASPFRSHLILDVQHGRCIFVGFRVRKYSRRGIPLVKTVLAINSPIERRLSLKVGIGVVVGGGLR